MNVIPLSVEEHQVTVQIPSSNRNKELPSSTSDLSKPQVEDDSPIPNAQCHHKAQPSIEEVEATPNLTQLFLQKPKPDNPCASTQSLDVSCPIPPSSFLFSDCASSDDSSQSNSKLTLSKTSKISASENSCDNTTDTNNPHNLDQRNPQPTYSDSLLFSSTKPPPPPRSQTVSAKDMANYSIFDASTSTEEEKSQLAFESQQINSDSGGRKKKTYKKRSRGHRQSSTPCGYTPPMKYSSSTHEQTYKHKHPV